MTIGNWNGGRGTRSQKRCYKKPLIMKVLDAKFKKNFPKYAALTNGKSPTI